MANRALWATRHNLDETRIVTLEQVHEDAVLCANSSHGGSGFLDPVSRISRTDGLITDDPTLILVTGHADCAPIFLFNEGARAIGLVHAGWRSTLLGICGKAVSYFCGEFSVSASELQVAVGPMITTRSYEVSKDLASRFVAKFGPSVVAEFDGRPHLDIFACILIDLQRAGVSKARHCPRPPDTYSNLRWSSYRRDGERAGGMLAFLTLN